MICATLMILLVLSIGVWAGDLEPSGPPDQGTMHTLDEIYTKMESVEQKIDLISSLPVDYIYTIKTMATMRAIGTALGSWNVDNNAFPATLNELYPDYYDGSLVDGWGTAYVYISINNGGGYELISYGSDRVSGPLPRVPWLFGDSLASDIVYINGGFTQAP